MFKVIFILLLPFSLFAKFHVTTHFPLESFLVKQIGQNYIRIKEISNLYSTKVKELSYTETSKLASSRAFFHFNLPAEQEYAKILKNSNEKILIVDMSMGIKKISNNNKVNHYVWMDPILLRDIAKNIYDALVKLDKFNASHYKQNYELLLTKLDEEFLTINKKLSNSEIYNIFVFSEYWEYFAKRFRIYTYHRKQKYLKANEINELNAFVESNEIKAILISSKDAYPFAKSIAGNSNIKIKTHDIFEELYFYNLSTLTNQLSK